MLATLSHDLRLALRALRRRPGFTAAAMLTLALGIGANTAVFSAAYGVLLRPLPYPESGRLVSLWPSHFYSNAEIDFLRAHARTIDHVEALSPGWNVALSGDGEPMQLAGAHVSPGLFAALGVRPALGRAFTNDEALPANDDVVMLSEELWRTRFGADPHTVGRRIVLDGVTRTIVGVMPAGFAFQQQDAQLWLPLVVDPTAWFHKGGMSVGIARLRTGATVAQAASELRVLATAMRAELQLDAGYGSDATVMPLHDALVGGVRTTLLVLLGAAGFIVLIAAANVGNLLLVRASERRREVAVRVALGAGRARLVSQFLVESVVLSLGGGAIGLLIGWAGVGFLRGSLPADMPRVNEIRVDVTVLAACALVTIVVGLAFGLAPALLAARTDPQQALRERAGDASGRAGSRMRDALVTAEVALAFVLVVGAGLMIRTLWNLTHVDPGFRGDGVATFALQPATSRIATAAAQRHYYVDVSARLARLPGVHAVGGTQHLPLDGAEWWSNVTVQGRALAPGTPLPRAGFRIIVGDYFRAMSIPLLAGRTFDARDDSAGGQVAIISEAMARRIWPNESPLGRRFTGQNGTRNKPVTVIGIVGSVRHAALAEPPQPEYYRPITQQSGGAMHFIVRTDDDPSTHLAAIQSAVRAADPDVPIAKLRTLGQVVSQSVAIPRLVMTLLVAFAIVGLALGAVGVYGVVAYAVGRRTHEIGVRVALGAARGSITRMVVGGGVRSAAIGVAVGLVAALSLAHAMSALVFGVRVTDPLTYAALAAFLLIVAAMASWIPARRAARVDPMVALRGR